MAIDLLDLGPTTPDGGKEGGTKINAMFTELYSVSLNSAGSVDGTDQAFSGHIAVGENASVSATSLINAQGDMDATAPGQTISSSNWAVGVGGGQMITQGVGMSFLLQLDDVGVGSSGTGISCAVTLSPSQTVDVPTLAAFSGVAINGNASKSVTDLITFRSNSGLISNGGATNIYGYKTADLGNSRVVNAYGASIDKQTGSTNNYGLVLNGDGVGADVVFGAGKDSNIYEHGSYFVIDPDMQGVGGRYLKVPAPIRAETFISDYIHLDQPTSQNVGGSIGTTTLISWDTVALNADPDFTHDEGGANPSRIVVNSDGRYSINAKINTNNTGVNRCVVEIYVKVNGVQVSRTLATSYSRGVSMDDELSSHIISELELLDTDYVEIEINMQDTEQTSAVNTVTATCELIMRRIG